MTQRIAIIGNGPAGIEAATVAARAGAQVTLIGEGPVGGRAGWHSLTPSKVWLTAADTYGLFQEAAQLGTVVTGARPDPQAVLARIRAVTAAWNEQQAASLRRLGVELLNGVAAFSGPHSLTVQAQDFTHTVHADAVIVATGSVPRFPPGMQPDGERILAPRFASHLAQLPPDVVVVGGGATGTEFAYLFNRLGLRVTWVLDQAGILPRFAPDVGRFLADVMARRGVDLAIGQPATAIERNEAGITVITRDGGRHTGSMAFLAIGRTPDLARLALDAAGLSPGPGGGLETDAYGQTRVPGIYAVGDATGAPMLANRATAQARIAARHALGLPTPPFRPETVVHAVYCEPQVAQVGTLQTASNQLLTVRLPFTAGLKGHLLAEGDGFVELAYDKHDRRVVGGVAVGPHAADVLAPVALAIAWGATVEQLAEVAGAHPTVSELAFLAAQEAGPWVRRSQP